MTTAIDRAAKAISATRFVTSDGQTCPQNIARSALATTRVPTLEMINAGAKAIAGTSSRRECADAVWQAMWDQMMVE